MKIRSAGKGSPNLNGRCERFVETIKLKCLSKFIIFGKCQLDYLVSEFVTYYKTKRSHMEREHLPPAREKPEEGETLTPAQFEINSYAGRLVKSFERRTT